MESKMPCSTAGENHTARTATATAAAALKKAASVANKFLGTIRSKDLLLLVRPRVAIAKTANKYSSQNGANDGVNATKIARAIESISGGKIGRASCRERV